MGSRKIAQYFYSQRQTQVMNEGWTTFWHHRLLNDMYDAGHNDQGILLECLHSISGRGSVQVCQPRHD